MAVKLKESIRKEVSDLMMINYQDIDSHASDIENFLDRGGRVIVREPISASSVGTSTWQNQGVLDNGTFMPLRIVQSITGESDKTEQEYDRTTINNEAWKKYKEDAFISSAIDRLAGRVFGRGFGISSHIYEIQEYIDELVESPINELYSGYLGFGIRKMVEYELFLRCTIHIDGFIEFDVIEPDDIKGIGDYCKHGIVHHKTKKTMPVWYRVKRTGLANNLKGSVTDSDFELIPSIYQVYIPEFSDVYSVEELKGLNAIVPKKDDALFRKSKGNIKYKQYILNWKHGVKEIIRNVSKLRTIFEPLEDYKKNKRWRSDYMKALSSYFIFYEFEDKIAWYRWQALTADKKRETGLLQPLRPADRLLVPPGIKATIQSPQLPKLSGDDEDLLKWMATAANTPYDIFASDSKGPTYASTKSSRPFYMDYINDWQGFTEQFFIYDFFRFAFYVKSKLDKKFKYSYPVEICKGFKNKKPVFEMKKVPAYKLITCTFPDSQETALADVANGVLGSKRGDLTWHLGVSKKLQAKKLGIQNYQVELMKRAEEENQYPEDLVSNVGNSDMVYSNQDSQNNEGQSNNNQNNNDNKQDKSKQDKQQK